MFGRNGRHRDSGGGVARPHELLWSNQAEEDDVGAISYDRSSKRAADEDLRNRLIQAVRPNRYAIWSRGSARWPVLFPRADRGKFYLPSRKGRYDLVVFADDEGHPFNEVMADLGAAYVLHARLSGVRSQIVRLGDLAALVGGHRKFSSAILRVGREGIEASTLSADTPIMVAPAASNFSFS